jgi:hypothetical protein
MSPLSIHSLDPEVERRIREKARRDRKSLNQTLKELLAASVGRSPQATPDRRADFAEFAGTWSDEDVGAFEQATIDLERIDGGDWA